MYYTNIIFPDVKKKTIFKSEKDILEFIAHIGIFLLRLPFKTVFDTLNQLNTNYNICKINYLVDLSKSLEHIIVEQYKEIEKKKNWKKQKKKELIKEIINNVSSFIYIKETFHVKLIILKKGYSNYFQKRYWMKLLKLGNLPHKIHIKLWVKICQKKK